MSNEDKITLEDIESSVRLIRSQIKIPSNVLKEWVRILDKLLPEEIRDDQIEYSIASASKEKPSSEDIKETPIALALILRDLAAKAYQRTVAHAIDSA